MFELEPKSRETVEEPELDEEEFEVGVEFARVRAINWYEFLSLAATFKTEGVLGTPGVRGAFSGAIFSVLG